MLNKLRLMFWIVTAGSVAAADLPLPDVLALQEQYLEQKTPPRAYEDASASHRVFGYSVSPDTAGLVGRVAWTYPTSVSRDEILEAIKTRFAPKALAEGTHNGEAFLTLYAPSEGIWICIEANKPRSTSIEYMTAAYRENINAKLQQTKYPLPESAVERAP